jgi:hypothetical protein
MADDGAAVAAGRWDTDPLRPHPGGGSWIDPGPVESPEPAAERAKQERLSPGDPSCGACAASPRRCCGEHRDYHHSYDPVNGLGARRKPAPAAPDDRVHDWSADVRRTTAETVDLSRTVR